MRKKSGRSYKRFKKPGGVAAVEFFSLRSRQPPLEGAVEIESNLREYKSGALNRALAPVLKSQIARRHAFVALDVAGRTLQDELAELHHVGAVGDFQRGLRVLVDQEQRDAGTAQLADGAEDVGDDDRRKPQARLVQHQKLRRAH